MQIQATDATTLPMSLLLLADPNVEKVQGYLSNSLAYSATQDGLVLGACIIVPLADGALELMNVAVSDQQQQQGIGSRLLQYVIEDLRKQGVTRLALGTGSFGYQLRFYQRLGFRVESVVTDFFIDSYPQAIVEDGLQHKDMLRLALAL